MADSNDPEVVIVGAGPTGLMAAVLLARLGIRVRIFDQNPQQAHESRALGVQARTMELFLSLGLDRAMLARGTIVNGVRMFENGQPRAEIAFDDLGRTDTPFSYFLVVPQRDTEAILNEELQRLGVPVERNVAVISLAQTTTGATVHARGADGTTFDVAASYVIGADGAHSIVRKQLGLSFEGAAYAQGFLLADCQIDWPLGHDRLMLFMKGKHFAVHFPLPDAAGRGRILAMEVGHQDPHAPVETQGGTDVPLDEVQAAFRAATGMDVTLRNSIWTSRYRVHHRGVDRYRVGRVFVAGDAAHIHSPAGGQGMNTGLQDAANLAWKLALALRAPAATSDQLVDSYHDERWPVGHNVLKYTDKMFATVTSQSDWVVALRNTLLPRLAGSLMHLESVRAKAFHFLSELGIHYEPSPFVREVTKPGESHAWKQGPAAGHRAPNAAFARNRDIFELLTGYAFHVLAFSRRSLPTAEIERLHHALTALPTPPALPISAYLIGYPETGNNENLLRAESSQAFAAYGVSHDTPDALYLVRPDGYIAWRSPSLDVAALANFLREQFGASAPAR